jgi:hypothetical protein
MALGVVRALRAHDVPTHLVAPPGDIAARSSGVILLAHGSAIRRSEDALRSFLSDTHLDSAVVIACADDWLRTIARIMEHDSGSFTSSMPASSVIELLLDKGAFAHTLEALAIDRPRTFEVRSAEDLPQVDDDELVSFLLKPRDYLRFAGQLGQKAFPLSEREVAAEQLHRALAGGHEMLLQEWIPGPPRNHVVLDGFVDRHGRVVGRLARRRIRMYPARFGNSTDTVTIPMVKSRTRRIASVACSRRSAIGASSMQNSGATRQQDDTNSSKSTHGPGGRSNSLLQRAWTWYTWRTWILSTWTSTRRPGTGASILDEPRQGTPLTPPTAVDGGEAGRHVGTCSERREG